MIKTKPTTFSKSAVAYGLEDVYASDAYDSKLQLKVAGRTVDVIDLVSGLGTNLFGYEYKVAQLFSPSLVHRAEREAGEALGAWVRDLMNWNGAGVVFCSTGSEATHIAVRIARALTNRIRVGFFRDHYHGWLDTTTQRVQPHRGVLRNDQEYRQYGWGDHRDILLGARQLACLMFEHPTGKSDPDWVKAVNNVKSTGAFLIADEVVTGFRYGKGLISAKYGYTPDIICLGKALGNGARVGAVVMQRDIFDAAFDNDQPVFVSSTTHGEVSGMYAVIDTLARYTGDTSYLGDIGRAIRAILADNGVATYGDNVRYHLDVSLDNLGSIIRSGINEGVLFGRVHFPNYAMTSEDIDEIALAVPRIIERSYADVGPRPRVLFKNR